MGQTRKATEDTNVYRVSAAGTDRWLVFQDPTSAPLASFPDKAAALNYAMCLARGRVAWHLLLRQNGLAGAQRATGNAHH